MGLLTDPVVLSDDGGVSTDRTFNFRAQLNEGSDAVVGEWIEPAAAAATQSKLVVKHTVSNAGVERHLIQRIGYALLPDGVTYSPIIVNLTIAHDPEMTAANVETEFNILTDAAGEANFCDNLVNGLI